MDDRAPLELTAASKKQMIVGCPKCKMARSVSVDWFASVCSKCGKYFNKNTALPEDECLSMLNTEKPIDTVYTARKADMERKAYAYKENVMDKKSKGLSRTHEPGDVIR